MALPLGTPDLPAQVLLERTHLTLPSQPHWIQPAVEYLQHKAILCGACSEARSRKLLLALHEALSNAIIHGNLEISSTLKEREDDAFLQALRERAADPIRASRVVDVVVHYEGDLCRWVITDQGAGFDVAKVLHQVTQEGPDALIASGRGIFLMQALMDDLKYEFGGRRVVLTMRRCLGDEKRREPRMPLHQPLHIAPIQADGSIDWSGSYNAISRNFSDTGVSLLQENLNAAQELLIGLSVNGEMMYLPAEIRHLRHMPAGIVELGCRFQTKITDRLALTEPRLDANLSKVQDALAQMLERWRRPMSAAGEQRSFPRMPFTGKIEVLSAELDESVTGFAHDLSKGGVGFLCTVMLPTLITVVFQARESGPVLKVRCEVVRCQKMRDNFYEVGARFLHLEEEL